MKFKPFIISFLVSFLSVHSFSQQHSSIRVASVYGGNQHDGNYDNFDGTVHTFYKGKRYIVVETGSANFPVTDGSTYSGGHDVILMVIDDSANIVHAKYVGGSDYDYAGSIVEENGFFYVLGSASSSDFPITTGVTYNGGGGDVFVMKLDSNLNVIYSTLVGGTAADHPLSIIAVENGEVHFSAQTASSDYPVTNGSTYFSQHHTSIDVVITVLDASGNVSKSSYIGHGSLDYNSRDIILEGGIYYIATRTDLDTLPVTNGSTRSGSSDRYILRLDSNFNTVFASYFGGTGKETGGSNSVVVNGEHYVLGRTKSTDFPVTDGSTFFTGPNSSVTLTKWDSSGNILYSKYLPGRERREGRIYFKNGFIYVSVNYVDYILPSYIATTNGAPKGADDLLAFKIDSKTGNIVYSTYVGGSSVEDRNDTESRVDAFGNFYLGGVTYSSDFPTTDGSSTGINGSQFLTKLDANGNIVYSTVFDGADRDVSMSMDLSQINSPKGKLVSVFGTTKSADYPVTNGSVYAGSVDITYTQINLCPEGYDTVGDSLSPSLQAVCINGFVDQIKGKKIIIPSDSMSTVYRNGIPEKQREISAFYRWQNATSPSGPWVDIVGIVTQNYSPDPATFDRYFRRISTMGACCDYRSIDTSAVASVLVNTFTAPTVDAGGVFNTCPGVNVTIGGTPAALGGLAPYSFHWDNISTADSALSNPSVAIANSSIFTLTVVDDNGCKQVDQALINAHTANAGPDVVNCEGDSVRIQGVPLAGIPGATYSWTPATGLSNPNVAQPMVLVGSSTNFTLTMTVPITGGGTCNTNDVVNVSPVSAPITVNFAGADQTICLGSIANLGTASEAGFTYTWAPGNYLNNNTNAQVNYTPGNFEFPNPDSAIYTLTASKTGCYFTDQVVVTSINADAGIDACGPLVMGKPLKTDHPNLNETFSWTVVSGTGTIIGPANGPTAIASGGLTPTTYRLTTTLNGVSCTDDAIIGGSGCGCGVDIYVDAIYGCPTTAWGDVTLTAKPLVGNPSDYTFSWSPIVGLTSYNTDTASLTDTVSRTYTVTITSLIDPSITCSRSIDVNHPAMGALPVFTAQDTLTCEGTVVNLGQTTVGGYGYLWSPVDSLSSAIASNPTVTARKSESFYVTVTDLGTTCFTKDTATITIQDVTADAGLDYVLCSPTTIKLGTGSSPNVTYKWKPSTASYQNGTDSMSAQPDVLVAITTIFTVIATDTLTGCMAYDTVEIEVNGSPTLPNAPDVTICAGESDTIGLPAIAGATYLWSSPSGTTDLDDPTKAQPIVTPTNPSVIYTVTVTFIGGCSASDPVTVSLSDPSFTLTDLSYCPSAGPVALGGTSPVGMTTYAWSPASQVTDATIPNPTTLTPPPNSPTNFTLTVTNSDGCKASDVIKITPTISAPNAGSSKALCLNETTKLGDIANPTGVGITYSWSPTTGLSSSTDANPTLTPAAVGSTTYTLTKTEAGCSSTSDATVIVKDYILPAMTSPNICMGGSALIGVPNQMGAQYSWNPGSGLSDSTVSMPAASPSSTTIYNLTSIGANGCVATGLVIVGVSASPAPTLTLVDTIITCLGATPTVQFTPSVSPSGSYNYAWSPNDGTIDSINNLNPNITVGGIGNKTYTLSVTDSVGCSATDSAVLVVGIARPVPVNLNAGRDTTLCDSTYNLMATSVHVDSGIGEWVILSYPGSAPLITNKYDPTSFISFPDAGNYTLVWEVNNGTCSQVSDAVSIRISNPQAVIDSYVFPTCATQGSLTGMGSPSGSYQYSITSDSTGFQSSLMFTGLDTGFYQLWVRETAAPNCVSGTPDTITLLDTLLPLTVDTAYFTPVVACNGATTGGEITVSATGEGSIAYSLSGSSTGSNMTGIFSNLLAGTYTITATDSLGCSIDLIKDLSLPEVSCDTLYRGIPSTGGTDSSCLTGPGTGGPFDVRTCDGSGNSSSGVGLIFTGLCVKYTSAVIPFKGDTACIVVCDTIIDTTGNVLVEVCDTTRIIYYPIPQPDTIILHTNGGAVDSCLSTDELIGSSYTYSSCGNPVHGNLTSMDDTCFTYTPTANELDTACVVICDEYGLCDTTVFIFIPPVTPDTVITSNLVTCVDTTEMPLGYDTIMSCDGTAMTSNGGSFTINQATGCVTTSPNFSSSNTDTTCIVVCDFDLNLCDTTWIIILTQSTSDTIVQLTNGNRVDTCLSTSELIGSSFTYLSCGLATRGVLVNLDSCYQYFPVSNKIDTACVVICDEYGLCDTTLFIYIPPVTTDTIYTMDTIVCVDTLEIPGGYQTIGTCDGMDMTNGGGSVVSDVSSGCVTISPVFGSGVSDTTCVIICNTLHGVTFCDTTIIINKKVSTPDTIYACIPRDGQIVGSIINTNDLLGSIVSTTMIQTPIHGQFSLYNDTITSYQTSPFPILDTVTVRIDDMFGCYDLFTFIYIPPMRNDTIKRQGGGVICVDTSEMPASEHHTIGTCDSKGVTYNDGLVSILSGSCVDILPNYGTTGVDTTCIIICDTLLPMCECDTTIIITFKPTVPDTFAILLPKGTNTADTCLSASELFGSTYTYRRIGAPAPHGPVTTHNDTCINYVQTSTTKYLDTARVLICDECGNCDTTIIIYVPTPDPDTLMVGPVAPVTNVDTCVVIESSYMTGMHIGTCDATGTTSLGVPLTITGNCVRYPVLAPVFTGDTACIIVCDTIRNIIICDTTLIVYLPDVTPPTVICKDDTVYLNNLGTAMIDTSDVLGTMWDNTLINSVWLSNTTFNSSNVGQNTVTVYAQDTNRNVDSCVANVTVLDTISPIVICQNIIISLDSNGNVSIIALDIDGGSYDNTGIASVTINQTSFDCSHIGMNNVTLTVTDIHGNVSTCTAVVTVEDVISPIIYCPGNQERVLRNTTCSYVVEDFTGQASVWENCLGDDIAFTQAPQAGDVVILDNSSITIMITGTDASGNSSSCSFEVHARCVKDIVIPQFISPNGDGTNDTWEIPELAFYPENTVKVFNRWGNIVFEQKGYYTGWDGKSNIDKGVNRLIDNKVLPVGTYFYIIDLGEKGSEPHVGYMQLKK